MSSLLIDEFRGMMNKKKIKESTSEILYPTGFLNFDFMNGYIANGRDPKTGQIYSYYNTGIADGSINMVISRSGGGKSSWCAQVSSNIVRPFPLSYILEDNVEAGMITERRMQLSRFTPEEYRKKYIVRNEGITIESYFENLKAHYNHKMENRDQWEYDTGQFDMYGQPIIKLQPTISILDSLAMISSEKVFEADELAGNMAATAAARAISTSLNALTPLCKQANITIFMINHINEDVSINPMMHKQTKTMYLKQGEAVPKGNKPLYASTNIIRIDDKKMTADKGGFGIDGTMSTISLVKSRTARPNRGTTLVFNYDTGFDPELSLFIMLKEAGRLNGAGVGYYFGERSDKKFSQKNFLEKLHTDQELFDIFQEECYNVLTSSISKHVFDNTEQSKTVTSLMDRLHSARL